jgi:hypothetical protein
MRVGKKITFSSRRDPCGCCRTKVSRIRRKRGDRLEKELDLKDQIWEEIEFPLLTTSDSSGIDPSIFRVVGSTLFGK